MSDPNESTALIIPEDASVKVVPVDQLPDLNSMDEGMSLAPQYKEFREGVPERAVFCGFSEMQSQNRTGQEDAEPKMIPLGVFQSTTGVWVHAGANLVQQVRNVPIGTPLQITYKGKERTKRGNDVAVFEVRLLKAPGEGGNQQGGAPPAQSGSASAPVVTPATTTGAQSSASPKGDKAPIEKLNMIGAVARAKKVSDLEGLCKQMLSKSTGELTSDEADILMDYLKTL